MYDLPYHAGRKLGFRLYCIPILIFAGVDIENGEYRRDVYPQLTFGNEPPGTDSTAITECCG
jgi:hypothetical protein